MELLVNIQEPNLKLNINLNSYVCDLKKNLSAASRDDEPPSEVEHEMMRTLSERIQFRGLRCARFLTD